MKPRTPALLIAALVVVVVLTHLGAGPVGAQQAIRTIRSVGLNFQAQDPTRGGPYPFPAKLDFVLCSGVGSISPECPFEVRRKASLRVTYLEGRGTGDGSGLPLSSGTITATFKIVKPSGATRARIGKLTLPRSALQIFTSPRPPGAENWVGQLAMSGFKTKRSKRAFQLREGESIVAAIKFTNMSDIWFFFRDGNIPEVQDEFLIQIVIEALP